MSRDVRLQAHADPALRARFLDACRSAGAKLHAYVDALHSATEAARAAEPLLSAEGDAGNSGNDAGRTE